MRTLFYQLYHLLKKTGPLRIRKGVCSVCTKPFLNWERRRRTGGLSRKSPTDSAKNGATVIQVTFLQRWLAYHRYSAQADYSVMEGWDSFLWGSLDGSSTPLLYMDGFNFPDKKARFALSDWVEPVEFPEEYDLHINNGRMLEHFHEGNLTNKSDGIQRKYLRFSWRFHRSLLKNAAC